jgi:hypothetical protein
MAGDGFKTDLAFAELILTEVWPNRSPADVRITATAKDLHMLVRAREHVEDEETRALYDRTIDLLAQSMLCHKHGLAELLRSDLPPEDRRRLANLLDSGEIKPRRGRPLARGKAAGVAIAIAYVTLVKRWLRNDGQRYGTHDRAIKFALAEMSDLDLPLPSRESIENALKRPRKRKSRRKPKYSP